MQFHFQSGFSTGISKTLGIAPRHSLPFFKDRFVKVIEIRTTRVIVNQTQTEYKTVRLGWNRILSGCSSCIYILSLENIKRKTGKDVGESAIHTTFSFILFYIPYSQCNATLCIWSDFHQGKNGSPQKTAALVFPSTSKPAVDTGQNSYKAKEEGEAQRKVKWHLCAPSGKFHS